MELKIPQLILAKIAHMGTHETVNTRSEHYSPRVKGSTLVRGIFFAEFILLQYNSGHHLFKENLIGNNFFATGKLSKASIVNFVSFPTNSIIQFLFFEISIFVFLFKFLFWILFY